MDDGAVSKLLAGPAVIACEACVRFCNSILEATPDKLTAR